MKGCFNIGDAPVEINWKWDDGDGLPEWDVLFDEDVMVNGSMYDFSDDEVVD